MKKMGHNFSDKNDELYFYNADWDDLKKLLGELENQPTIDISFPDDLAKIDEDLAKLCEELEEADRSIPLLDMSSLDKALRNLIEELQLTDTSEFLPDLSFLDDGNI